MRPEQASKHHSISLRRLLASVTCFAAALGLQRIAVWEVHFYGSGALPSLLYFAAILSATAAIGLLFRKTPEFLLVVLDILSRIFCGIV